MAIDALEPRHCRRPRLPGAGVALAEERRILKARRALERSVAALLEGSDARREPLDDGA